MTLVPIREVRVMGDTVINIIFGGDTLFLTTIIGGSASTSRALAPAGPMYSSSSLATLAATMPLRPAASRTFLTFLVLRSEIRIGDTVISRRPIRLGRR